MALTDEGSNGIGATMLVGPTGYGAPMMPMYGGGMGGFGNGGDWWGILLLIALLNGGFGGFGGFGGGVGYDFPWLLNGQQQISNNTNDGFRDAQLHDAVTSVRDGVSNLATQLCGCCGDIQMALANGFAGNAAAITGAQNALTSQLYQNEIASLNRSFAEQQANQAGFTGVNAGIADLKYTEATEACATRTAAAQNTRDIVDAIRSGNQSVLDKLCQLELDNYKAQLASAQRDNAALQNQVILATERADRTAQTGTIIDGIYNRLASCPVDTTPVYGRQPIFTCPQSYNPGCGCGAA